MNNYSALDTVIDTVRKRISNSIYFLDGGDVHDETICTFSNGEVVSLDIVGDLNYVSFYNALVERGYESIDGKLVSIKIGNGITSVNRYNVVGINPFVDERMLSSIVIPASVKILGFQTFRFKETNAPRVITYSGTIKEWNNITIESNWCGKNDMFVIYCTDGVVILKGDEKIGEYSNTSTITIYGDGTVFSDYRTGELTKNYLQYSSEYDAYVFTYCVIGNSVTSLNCEMSTGTFEYNDNLEVVVIPDSVTIIDDHTFSNCGGLKIVVFGNSVSSIGGNAFYGCGNLTRIELPDSISIINDNAFMSCSNLLSVTYNGIEYTDATGLVDALKSNGVCVGDNVFYGTNLTSDDESFDSDFNDDSFIDSDSESDSDSDFYYCYNHPETICTYADGSKLTYNIVGAMYRNNIAGRNNGYRLVSCEIGNTVTSLAKRNNCLGTLENNECLSTIVIPSSVTKLSEFALNAGNSDVDLTVIYLGTVEQWNNLDDDSLYLFMDTPNRTIICSDGIVYDTTD